MTDPSLHMTERIPPRLGDLDDPHAETLGEPMVPPDGPALPPQTPPDGPQHVPDGQPEPQEGQQVPLDEPPAAAGSRRWHLGPRSLTARLVSGVVALVLAVVVATGLSTYFALRSFLIHRLDQQVASIAAANESTVEFCVTRGIPDCGLGPGVGRYRAATTEWVAVLNQAGQVAIPVNSTPALQGMSLTPGQASDILSDPTAPRTVETTNGASLRVTARVVPPGDNNGQELVVVSGLATSEVDRTLHQLILLEWLIGGAAVVVALLATAGGVRFSLRQLHRVTATAQEVAAELSPEGAGLDRRVPVDDPNTEVGQLAVSMNTLLSAVETQFAARLASEHRMRQFLADASHELRTPLTSIRGYAELARMQRDFGDTESVPANLGRIESEGTRMSRLIDDLLLLARSDQALESGAEPVRELLDVDVLLDDVVTGTRAAYPDRDIRLDTQHGLAVVGDSDQLVRAVRNLVVNAAMHTRPDGPIGVSAHREADTVVIQVADSGPGLPPEQAAHVFERFWRADKARSRARGGSGLGMSIVASIVAAHGGTVRFDSAVATGSTATIWLPAALT
jgi:two-component system OmpR family sensor kinase